MSIIASNSNAQEDLSKLAAEFRQASNTLIEGRYPLGEELIFSVQVGKYKIGEVNALAIESGLAFELSSYVAVFDFPISLNSSLQIYEGWFIEESNTISIVLQPKINNEFQLEVDNNGQRIILESQDFEQRNNALFISDNALSEIFGIEHTYNFEKLVLQAKSDELLPFMQTVMRRNAQNALSSNSQAKYINLPRGYELISPQIIDFQIATDYSERTEDIRTNYSIQGARDLALWHTQFSLSGNQDKWFNDSRLNFSRESLEGEIFGNTGVTRFEFGDVRDVRQANGSSLQESLGLRFTNTPIDGFQQSDFINIDGDIPIGWDVELYRNNILINQEFDIQNGRYNFLDVPLIYGRNEFEVVLYGPQGQVRTRTIERIIDETTFSNKDFSYDVSLTNLDRSVIDINDTRDLQNLGYNFSARGTIYAFEDMGIDLGVRTQFGGDFDQSQINLGLNKVLFSDLLFNINADINDDAVTNVQSSVRTQLLDQSLSFQLNASDISEVVSPRQLFASVGLDGNVPLADNFSIPLNQQLSYTDTADFQRFDYSNRLSLYFGRFSLFHTATYSRTKNLITNESNSDLIGNLGLQGNFGNIYARVSAAYSPDADETLTALQSSLDWNFSQRFKARLSYSLDNTNDNTTYGAQLGYIGDRFRLAANVGHSDIRGFDVGLNASFSLAGKHSYVAGVEQQGHSQLNTGIIDVRVFVDKNLNAVFDAGDEVLKDVEVLAPQFFRKQQTNENGIASLDRLPNQRSSDITINRDTLPNPFYRPLVEGVSLTSRAGLVDFLDFPVVPASEINGLLELEGVNGFSAAAHVNVELVDFLGRVVETAKTEFDGYYSFVDIAPGTYVVTVKNAQNRRIDVDDFRSEPIIIKNESDIFTNDYLLTEKTYRTVYLTRLARVEQPELVNLQFIQLNTHLKKMNEKLYVTQDSISGDYVFYSAIANHQEAAEKRCNTIRVAKLNCEVAMVNLSPKDALFIQM